MTSPRSAVAVMMLVMMAVMVMMLLDRIIGDWVKHSEMLLGWLVAERRPANLGQRQLGVGHAVKQVAKQGQPAEGLVVEVDQGPRREVGVGRRQHQLARLGVVVVMLARLDIDRRKLPAFHGV